MGISASFPFCQVTKAKQPFLIFDNNAYKKNPVSLFQLGRGLKKKPISTVREKQANRKSKQISQLKQFKFNLRPYEKKNIRSFTFFLGSVAHLVSFPLRTGFRVSAATERWRPEKRRKMIMVDQPGWKGRKRYKYIFAESVFPRMTLHRKSLHQRQLNVDKSPSSKSSK